MIHHFYKEKIREITERTDEEYPRNIEKIPWWFLISGIIFFVLLLVILSYSIFFNSAQLNKPKQIYNPSTEEPVMPEK